MFKHILIPVDLQETEYSNRAIAIAVAQARENNARLHVMTVVPGFGMPMVASFFPAGTMDKAMHAVEQTLRDYVSRNVPDDVEISTSVSQGHPAETITSEARRLGIDLIVMPSHTRSKLDKRFIGSCAQRVVELAKCSVLVVRGPT